MEKNLGRMLAAFFAAAEATKGMMKDIDIQYLYNHEFGLGVVFFRVGAVETEVDFELKTEKWTFDPPTLRENTTLKDIPNGDASRSLIATGAFLHKISATTLEDTLELAYEGYYDCIKNYYKLGD